MIATTPLFPDVPDPSSHWPLWSPANQTYPAIGPGTPWIGKHESHPLYHRGSSMWDVRSEIGVEQIARYEWTENESHKSANRWGPGWKTNRTQWGTLSGKWLAPRNEPARIEREHLYSIWRWRAPRRFFLAPFVAREKRRNVVLKTASGVDLGVSEYRGRFKSFPSRLDFVLPILTPATGPPVPVRVMGSTNTRPPRVGSWRRERWWRQKKELPHHWCRLLMRRFIPVFMTRASPAFSSSGIGDFPPVSIVLLRCIGTPLPMDAFEKFACIFYVLRCISIGKVSCESFS